MSDTSTPRPQDSEHQEPGDMIGQAGGGLESPPLWMWLVIFVALFSGVYFLGANLGNIGTDPWPQGGEIPVIAVAETPSVDGGAVYNTRCVICHQANGEGVAGIFPPLSNSEWVTGNPDIVTQVVLQGLQGPIEVAGTAYNSIMPGLGTQLKDDEIAAVVSHVRSNFGNSASAVSEADVARVRDATQGQTQPWTADDLGDMPAAAAPVVSTPAPAPAASTPAPVSAAPVVAATSGGSDASGSALFEQYACNTCHSVDSPTALVGPSLFDVGSRLTRAEIYESIVDPDATITEGYAAGAMSAMVSALNFSGSELNKMVEYLASLKR